MQTFSKEKPIKCRKAILAYGVYHPAGSLAFCYPIIFYILPFTRCLTALQSRGIILTKSMRVTHLRLNQRLCIVLRSKWRKQGRYLFSRLGTIMFGLKKKSRKVELVSPVNGKMIRLRDVPDQVFASENDGPWSCFYFQRRKHMFPMWWWIDDCISHKACDWNKGREWSRNTNSTLE